MRPACYWFPMLLGRADPKLRLADLPDPATFDAFTPFIKGVFSQWHAAGFEALGLRFVTAEQWMMFAKAKLFDDEARAAAILGTADPGQQKRLGAAVEGFDSAAWDRWKVDIVHFGNLQKFGQNPGALRQLNATVGSMLVEANPRDWIWGVGLAVDDPQVRNPAAWRGSNLLGRVLTQVRDELADPNYSAACWV